MTEQQALILGRLLGVVALGVFLYGNPFRRRRYTRELEEALERSHSQMMYLAAMFDKYDLEIDEFDLIALRNL